MNVPLRLLIIAQDALTRAGLAAILSQTDQLEPVGQATPADNLEEAIAAFRPDLLLWDLGYPNEEEIARLDDLVQPDDIQPDNIQHGVPCVVLLNDAELAREVWRSGVRAVVSRSAPPAKLAAACAAADQGLAVLDEQFLSAALETRPEESLAPIEPLTPREREVLQLMAQGLPNKSIARTLQISEHTVKFHVNAILTKLGAQSRTEAVVLASRAGLVVF